MPTRFEKKVNFLNDVITGIWQPSTLAQYDMFPSWPLLGYYPGGTLSYLGPSKRMGTKAWHKGGILEW